MTPQELLKKLKKQGYDQYWEEIKTVIYSETLLIPSPIKWDDFPCGHTKQGGTPDLPPEVPWPKYECYGVPGLRKTSKPMTFLLQLHCGTLKTFDPTGLFPDRGLLSFFVAMNREEVFHDSRGMIPARVIYTAPESSCFLQRLSFPKGLSHILHLEVNKLKLEQSWNVGLDALCDVLDRNSGTSAMDYEDYMKIIEFHTQELVPTFSHIMFGEPNSNHLNIFEECRCVFKEKEPDQPEEPFLLLLQYSLEEIPFLNGFLYFMIRRSDLAALQFDRVLVFYDSPV